MLKLIVIAVAVAVVAADIESDWLQFKQVYGKSYNFGKEEVMRKSIWADNKKFIEEHNKLYDRGLSTYYLGENEFTDMTNSEFVATLNGGKISVDYEPSIVIKDDPSLPDAVDWRKEGYVTPVKNQGKCRSSWAFSVTGAIEGQFFKSQRNLISMSESMLIDCSGMYGNQGCINGSTFQTYNYVAKYGIESEKSYPYHPYTGTCHYNASDVLAHSFGYSTITTPSEEALQRMVANNGPVSVTIDGSHKSFQFYKGGVYDEPKCSSTQLDHSALVVGYGTQKSTQTTAYWIVKNSWGTSWGEDGYIMMSRNKNNQCGIASHASVPF